MAAIDIAPQPVPNMKHDYEIRLLLDSTAVLNSNNEPTDTVLSAFKMPLTATKINVQFLDKSSLDLYIAGWSARIRKNENKKDLEFTYKKRYTISDGNIDAALDVANINGFNADNKKYEAQVEWGLEHKTLSISRKKDVDYKNNGTDLPGTEKARNLLIDEAPKEFDNSNGIFTWGTNILKESRIFGPILYQRFIGSWNGIPLYLEIWPLLDSTRTGIEYFVEASFKTESRDTASLEKENLAGFLQSKGWFLEQELLKTQIIMERY